jgi:hypothetical protein
VPYEVPALTPEQQAAWRVLDRVWDVMINGDGAALAKLEQEIESFPHGTDPALDRHWLTNAVDAGTISAVRWMVGRGVELSYVDDEGYTPLISALHVEEPNKRHEIMRLLLAAGSQHDLIGLNRWTAAHFAASIGDVDALQLLREFGADLCVCTEDLGSWSTPEWVATFHKHAAALAYLQGVCGGAEHRVT